MSEIGSLKQFLNPPISPKICTSLTKAPTNFSILRTHKTHTPRLYKKHSPNNTYLQPNFESGSLLPNISRRNYMVSISKSSSPIGIYEKVRGVLLLDKNHALLRCMNSNVREDERSRNIAEIEQRALDTVLNSFKNMGSMPKLGKDNRLKRFVFNKRALVNKNIRTEQNRWIAKHRINKYFDEYF